MRETHFSSLLNLKSSNTNETLCHTPLWLVIPLAYIISFLIIYEKYGSNFMLWQRLTFTGTQWWIWLIVALVISVTIVILGGIAYLIIKHQKKKDKYVVEGAKPYKRGKDNSAFSNMNQPTLWGSWKKQERKFVPWLRASQSTYKSQTDPWRNRVA